MNLWVALLNTHNGKMEKYKTVYRMDSRKELKDLLTYITSTREDDFELVEYSHIYDKRTGNRIGGGGYLGPHNIDRPRTFVVYREDLEKVVEEFMKAK